MSRSPDLTSAELRVMKALWQVESGTVADVRAELARRGQELAYTTVMTLLGRLATKHAVIVDKAREPFVYRPAHRRESVLRDRLRDFVREVFDGQAESLVLNLVEDESLSRAELRAIERKIAEAERTDKSGRTRSSADGDAQVDNKSAERRTRSSADGGAQVDNKSAERRTRSSAEGGAKVGDKK